ncbi:unnamed protein product [Mytilus edulis]|uniref:Uncharacterized protein n=1 Tax=Mytilus edulis TaxID=6550 RepID=A0A8S3RUZ8_MYTED|nr:unnamed protein product [Mytilus edulis]
MDYDKLELYIERQFELNAYIFFRVLKGKTYSVYSGKCVTTDLPSYPGKINCLPCAFCPVLTYTYSSLASMKQILLSIRPSATINHINTDAKLVLSTYYGSGDNKNEIDIYEFLVNGKKMEFSVTKGSCVPVGEHLPLTNGFADVGFMGITKGIKEHSVFDTSPECNRAGTVSPVG